ncbi:Bromodomain containing protein [Tritrichomonas foetus]|uniref:Bromodomain containing protein n=1 Tax=Tritrichomonas foetus TaxID=1144522 RepID=A0A1J4JK57_9EUKA|nr:Bromodomain containing protein [Tritrichomonas foetus]|eukprot:OHS97915.1 Bromodomain containing protein [Tritrichomonas foetus]
MASSSFQRCQSITEELIQQPLNQYFAVPVDPENDGLLDYFDKISNPMDFTTILGKLKRNEYESESDWYKDVCLIYENAMTYHPPEKIYHWIADYCLISFKKVAVGYEHTNLQDWYDQICIQQQKLIDLTAMSPVPQGVDPLISTILEKAKNMPQVPPAVMPDLMEKINKLMEKKEYREDIVHILHTLQPSLDLNSEILKINAGKLSNASQNSLLLYVRAH